MRQRLSRILAHLVPLTLGILAGLVSATLVSRPVHAQSSSTGPWSFFDNLTAQYVTVSCPPPVPGPAGPTGPTGATGQTGQTGLPGAPALPPTFFRQTLTPHTAAPLLLSLAGTGIAGKLPAVEGGSLYADPGGNGKITILAGDDALCSVNPQEIITFITSAMGGTLSRSTDPSLAGKFLCVRVTPSSPVLTLNGSVLWSVQ